MLHKRMSGMSVAMKGVVVAWREESNFRVEVICGALALFFSWLFGLDGWEWMIVIFLIGFVLSAEALNTSLEEFCDMVKGDPDPHIAKIKDLAAAAVLIASTTSIVVGALIFYPHIASL